MSFPSVRPAQWMGCLIVGLILVGWSQGARGETGSTAVRFVPLHGDLVFQRTTGRFSELIAGVTRSPYTHCGVVVRQGGEVVVLEAIGPVRFTPWREWRRRGRGGAVTVARLQAPVQDALIQAARRYLGRPYDDRFALGGHAIYCSELLYRAAREGAHVELGRPQKLRELHWRPWADRIRQLRNGALPLDERVITPLAVLRSPLVRVVYRGL